MKQNVHELVVAWKRVFTENCNGINQNSSWKDILLSRNLSPGDTFALVFHAAMQCGLLADNDEKSLHDLPYFDAVFDILVMPYCERKMAIFEKHLSSSTGDICFDDGTQVCFLFYPNDETNNSLKVPLIEAVIVTKEKVDLDVDIYTFFADYFTPVNIVLRYDTQIPQEWLVEKEKKMSLLQNETADCDIDANCFVEADMMP